MIIRNFIYKHCSFIKREKMLRKIGINIGKNSEIYPDVTFGSEPYLIKIGDNVRITSGVKFSTHDGGVWVLRNLNKLKDADILGKIEIGDNVHIGMNAIIMPNVKIGNNCVIGCGAIVTKNIPDNSVAVGVPAKVIMNINDYYNKHKDSCEFTKNLKPKEKKQYIIEKYKIKEKN